MQDARVESAPTATYWSRDALVPRSTVLGGVAQRVDASRPAMPWHGVRNAESARAFRLAWRLGVASLWTLVGGRRLGCFQSLDGHPALTTITRAAPKPAARQVFGDDLDYVTGLRRQLAGVVRGLHDHRP